MLHHCREALSVTNILALATVHSSDCPHLNADTLPPTQAVTESCSTCSFRSLNAVANRRCATSWQLGKTCRLVRRPFCKHRPAPAVPNRAKERLLHATASLTTGALPALAHARIHSQAFEHSHGNWLGRRLHIHNSSQGPLSMAIIGRATEDSRHRS
eukprot:6204024-Amphidinium_carterae.1